MQFDCLHPIYCLFLWRDPKLRYFRTCCSSNSIESDMRHKRGYHRDRRCLLSASGSCKRSALPASRLHRDWTKFQVGYCNYTNLFLSFQLQWRKHCFPHPSHHLERTKDHRRVEAQSLWLSWTAGCSSSGTRPKRDRTLEWREIQPHIGLSRSAVDSAGARRTYSWVANYIWRLGCIQGLIHLLHRTRKNALESRILCPIADTPAADCLSRFSRPYGRSSRNMG